MDEEKKLILIESYLEGTLKGQALVDFEQRLSSDQELAAEVNLHRDVDQQLVRQEQKKALRKEWEEIIETDAAPQAPATSKRSLFYYLPRIAAAVLFGILLYLAWPTSLSEQQLAGQYWEQTAVFQSSTIDRSSAPTPAYLRLLEQAYTAYEGQQYPEAIAICKQLSPPLEEVTLLLGAAQFANEDPTAAIQSFQSILDQVVSTNKEEARWYLALAYLKNGDRDNAQQTLATIIAQASWNHELAKTLLD